MAERKYSWRHWDHHYHPCTSRSHVIDREVLALFSENIYGQEKLCSKNPATIVGAAKSSAARIQKVAVRAATAAATAAAEAAVEAVMRSLGRRESTARGRTTAAKKPVRKTKRKATRKTSRKKRL
jgi:hypothetical protein